MFGTRCLQSNSTAKAILFVWQPHSDVLIWQVVCRSNHSGSTELPEQVAREQPAFEAPAPASPFEPGSHEAQDSLEPDELPVSLKLHVKRLVTPEKL